MCHVIVSVVHSTVVNMFLFIVADRGALSMGDNVHACIAKSSMHVLLGHAYCLFSNKFITV